MILSSSLYHRILQPLLVAVILLIGITGAIGFSMSDKASPPVQREIYAPLVRTIHSTASKRSIVLQGYGTLRAHTRIDIALQVSGRVTYVHPDFRAGGSIKSGEILVKIEQKDYRLDVIKNEAEVTSANTTLALVKAEALVAQKEWQALNPGTDIPALVSLKPQTAQAEAKVKAAEARLATAHLRLQRTQLRMPYDGRIVAANIGLSAIIVANQVIGELYKSDHFEIPIPLSLAELTWIKPFGTADIEFNIGKRTYTLTGRVSRIESELDERTRQAQLIITLLPKNITDEVKAHLVPGLFVSASVNSQPIDRLHLLPKKALREGNTLWAVVDKKIQVVKPTIIHQSGSNILLADIPENIEIITSHLDIATEGMQVRPMKSPAGSM